MERGAELESIDLNKGLSVAALEELIGERDYKQFLNSRNALYREMKMKENPPAPRGGAALDVRKPQSDQAAGRGCGAEGRSGGSTARRWNG